MATEFLGVLQPQIGERLASLTFAPADNVSNDTLSSWIARRVSTVASVLNTARGLNRFSVSDKSVQMTTDFINQIADRQEPDNRVDDFYAAVTDANILRVQTATLTSTPSQERSNWLQGADIGVLSQSVHPVAWIIAHGDSTLDYIVGERVRIPFENGMYTDIKLDSRDPLHSDAVIDLARQAHRLFNASLQLKIHNSAVIPFAFVAAKFMAGARPGTLDEIISSLALLADGLSRISPELRINSDMLKLVFGWIQFFNPFEPDLEAADGDIQPVLFANMFFDHTVSQVAYALLSIYRTGMVSTPSEAAQRALLNHASTSFARSIGDSDALGTWNDIGLRVAVDGIALACFLVQSYIEDNDITVEQAATDVRTLFESLAASPCHANDGSDSRFAAFVNDTGLFAAQDAGDVSELGIQWSTVVSASLWLASMVPYAYLYIHNTYSDEYQILELVDNLSPFGSVVLCEGIGFLVCMSAVWQTRRSAGDDLTRVNDLYSATLTGLFMRMIVGVKMALLGPRILGTINVPNTSQDSAIRTTLLEAAGVFHSIDEAGFAKFLKRYGTTRAALVDFDVRRLQNILLSAAQAGRSGIIRTSGWIQDSTPVIPDFPPDLTEDIDDSGAAGIVMVGLALIVGVLWSKYMFASFTPRDATRRIVRRRRPRGGVGAEAMQDISESSTFILSVIESVSEVFVGGADNPAVQLLVDHLSVVRTTNLPARGRPEVDPVPAGAQLMLKSPRRTKQIKNTTDPAVNVDEMLFVTLQHPSIAPLFFGSLANLPFVGESSEILPLLASFYPSTPESDDDAASSSSSKTSSSSSSSR